jgi:TetR/AcrR family transcriptional regulator, transcriptional repressor of bet genes
MPKLGMGPIRRAQIFRAATEVIARESFSGTTLRKVADAAGVSTGTVNHYFSNKRAMLIETLAHISAEWNDSTVRAVDGAEPGVPRLKSLVEASGPGSSINKLRWKVWMAAWGESVQSSELRAALRRSKHEWTDILAERLELINKELGGPKIDARQIAMQFDGMQNGLVVRMISVGGPADRQIDDILFDFLIDRIGPKSAVGATATPVASVKAARSRGRAPAAAAPDLDGAAAQDKAG